MEWQTLLNILESTQLFLMSSQHGLQGPTDEIWSSGARARLKRLISGIRGKQPAIGQDVMRRCQTLTRVIRSNQETVLR